MVPTKVEEEVKAKPESPAASPVPESSPAPQSSADMIGKEIVSGRKNSEATGAGLESLTGKSSTDEAQVVIHTETSPPAKLNDQLTKENLRHEQRTETKPHKVSELEVVNQDPMLKNFEHDIYKRINMFKDWLQKFDKNEKGIVEFAGSYKRFGLNRVPGGIQYREWAPGAKRVSLCGDFNAWNRESHVCKRNEYGVWELFVPDKPDGEPAIKHGSKVKASLILANGQKVSPSIAYIIYE